MIVLAPSGGRGPVETLYFRRPSEPLICERRRRGRPRECLWPSGVEAPYTPSTQPMTAPRRCAGHVLSVIFTTENYILFGSKSAFLAVVPGRNHSARSNTSFHSSFSLPKSSLEAPACVTPEVGQALSMAQN